MHRISDTKIRSFPSRPIDDHGVAANLVKLRLHRSQQTPYFCRASRILAFDNLSFLQRDRSITIVGLIFRPFHYFIPKFHHFQKRFQQNIDFENQKCSFYVRAATLANLLYFAKLRIFNDDNLDFQDF